MDTMQGGNRQPFVLRKYNNFLNKKNYLPEKFNPYNSVEIKDISPTQTTQCGSYASNATILINNDSNIRKLTPLECWRLMSFDDEDFYKAEKVNSNSQLYKQAR